MSLFNAFKSLGSPILPLVPDCSYCAAMRFALVSATLTGVVFGVGSLHFWSYLLIGVWIGVAQVIFLYVEYHATHEEEK